MMIATITAAISQNSTRLNSPSVMRWPMLASPVVLIVAISVIRNQYSVIGNQYPVIIEQPTDH
jgi:hypothetical protein